MIVSPSLDLVEDKSHALDVALLLSWASRSIVTLFSYKVIWSLSFEDSWRSRRCHLLNHVARRVLLNVDMHFWYLLIQCVLRLNSMYLGQAARELALEDGLHVSHVLLRHFLWVMRCRVLVEVSYRLFLGCNQMVKHFDLRFALRLVVFNFDFCLLCKGCLVCLLQFHPLVLALHQFWLSFDLKLDYVWSRDWRLSVVESKLRLAHVGVPDWTLGLVFNPEGCRMMTVAESSESVLRMQLLVHLRKSRVIDWLIYTVMLSISSRFRAKNCGNLRISRFSVLNFLFF